MFFLYTFHQGIAKGHMGKGFVVSSDRLENQGMELITPDLGGKWFTHYTTEALHYPN